MSYLLAIETATEACSAALYHQGQICERFVIAPRQHANLILPMVDELLAEAGIHRTQLSVIAVGRGPGAFTGVRLAISVGQGIALGLDIPAVAVSTLQCLALEVPADFLQRANVISRQTAILATIDARMGEIYAGCFVMMDGLPVAVSAEYVGLATDLLLPPAQQWLMVGSGYQVYSSELRNLTMALPIIYEDQKALPHAAQLARLGWDAYQNNETVTAELLQPVYLRNKVAYTTEERRQGHH